MPPLGSCSPALSIRIFTMLTVLVHSCIYEVRSSWLAEVNPFTFMLFVLSTGPNSQIGVGKHLTTLTFFRALERAMVLATTGL